MSDPGMQHGGVGATAAGFPPTAKALGTLVRTWTAVLSGGPVVALVGGLLIAVSGGSDTGMSLPEYLVVFGLGVPVAALVWLSYARKMRAALQRGPWVAVRATTVTSGINNPTVVLQEPATGEVKVFAARTALWTMDWADPGPAGVLWWAEHAEGGGVVCRPGGSQLVWVKALNKGRKREAGLAQAARRGLVQQPPHGAPQGWTQQPAPQQSPPGWGPQPGFQPAPQGWTQQPAPQQSPHPQTPQAQPPQHPQAPPQQQGWGTPPQPPPVPGQYPGPQQGPGQGPGGSW